MSRFHFLHRRHVLYPNHHAWFVLFSALDILLTHRILNDFAHVGGREVNTIADWVISVFGLWGAIGLKFLTVVVVVVVCEIVGHARPRFGPFFVCLIVALSTLPVIAALAQLAWFAVSR